MSKSDVLAWKIFLRELNIFFKNLLAIFTMYGIRVQKQNFNLRLIIDKKLKIFPCDLFAGQVFIILSFFTCIERY
jgi:hypothetical protein